MINLKRPYQTLAQISLLLFFSVLLVQITGGASALYERLTDSKDDQGNLRIAGAYYFTKVKQFGSTYGIEFLGGTNLAFNEGDGVWTHVFLEDGSLYESTVVEGAQPSVDMGFKITDISDLEMDIDQDILTINITSGKYSQKLHLSLRGDAND